MPEETGKIKSMQMNASDPDHVEMFLSLVGSAQLPVAAADVAGRAEQRTSAARYVGALPVTRGMGLMRVVQRTPS